MHIEYFVVKRLRKLAFGRLTIRVKFKINYWRFGCEDEWYIQLAQDRVQFRVYGTVSGLGPTTSGGITGVDFRIIIQ